MSLTEQSPLFIVNSVARIHNCDVDGGTGTWFAEYGCIISIGDYPYAEMQIEVYLASEGVTCPHS